MKDYITRYPDYHSSYEKQERGERGWGRDQSRTAISLYKYERCLHAVKRLLARNKEVLQGLVASDCKRALVGDRQKSNAANRSTTIVR
jgi:hypothetical protein